MCKNPRIMVKYGEKIEKTNLNLEQLKKIPKEMIVIIKCGKCIECRKEKIQEWTNKIEKEIEIRGNAYLLNLTYDENNIENLNKKTISKFIKRLRKKEKLRYFYVGELSEKNKRPHYHMIIFGEYPKDMKLCENEKSKRGYDIYKSEKIEKIWGKGRIRINKVNKKIIKYVLKYLFKNAEKEEFIYGFSKIPPLGVDILNIEKEIIKRKKTKSLKNYYKRHIGKIPINENEIEEYNLKKELIEKKTKLKYIDFLKKTTNL